jgi:hypothetical protein
MATRILKTWDGSTHVPRPVKIWDGSAWIEKQVKYWNGSTWLPKAVLMTDTFTDSAKELSLHTGELGAAWSKHPSYGNDSFISNASRCRAGGAISGYYASAVLPAEHIIITRFYVANVSQYFGVCARMSTTANTMYLIQANVGGSSWQIYRGVGGSFTVLDSVAQTFVAGTTYDVRIEITDALKRVYVNDVLKLSSNDNTVTGGGRVGIRSGPATDTTGVHLTELAVTEI